VPGDFTVDEKTHQVFLTEDGHENAERILSEFKLLPEGASLYDPANITLMHHLNAALRAATCTTATSITWCSRARWSSSTNSPAA
jgi:preprotein translocase subunit SecA